MEIRTGRHSLFVWNTDMILIRFCFLLPFSFLIPTESLPFAQPAIKPSHVLHIRKDFPGIISFGPIFISSVKRGIFTDHVSLNSCNGGPNNENPFPLSVADYKETPEASEIIEVDEPVDVVPDGEDKEDLEDGKIEHDLVADYNDYRNRSTLTSEQMYLIHLKELNRIREKELGKAFEVLNQVKEIPDDLEPGNEIKTPVQELSHVPSNSYGHVGHSYPKPNADQQPEMVSASQGNPFESQGYGNNSPQPGFGPHGHPPNLQGFGYGPTAPQGFPSEPYPFLRPVHGSIHFGMSISGLLHHVPGGGVKEVSQKPGDVQENSTEGNAWDGPTSPEVAQSLYEYIVNEKPGEIYPCPPKDSTQISDRHDSLIKSTLMGVSKKIKNYFDGIRAYEARYHDTA